MAPAPVENGRAHRETKPSISRRTHSRHRPFPRFPRESDSGTLVDALGESVYSHIVPVPKVQVGQVWKKDDSDDTFLITKIYSEALNTFAVLRKTGSEEEPPIRIKISKSGASTNLPGFTYTQDSDEF